MADERTRAELLRELVDLSQRLARMEFAQARHRRQQEVDQEARAHFEAVVDTVRDSLVILDGDLRVVSANRSFYETFQVTSHETEGKLLYELGNGQWDIPKLRGLLEEILPKTTQFRDFEVDHEFPAIGHRVMLLNARRIYREDDRKLLVLLAIEDITERKRSQEELKQRLKELQALNSLFQEHLRQRFTVIETHRNLLDELRRISENLNSVLQRSLSQPLPDLRDVANLEAGGGERSGG